MFIIDRFEGDFAVIEATDDNDAVNVLKVERHFVSDDAGEGDVLVFENGMFFPDKEATKQRKRKFYSILHRLK